MNDLNRKSGAWPIAFAAVAITAILATFFFFKGSRVIGVDNINTINTVLTAFVHSVSDKPKLVVLTGSVNAEVVKSSEAKTEIVVFGVKMGEIPRGTTTVTIKANDNKFQYYVDLAEITANSFVVDESRKRVTLTVQKPIVDETLIEVQSNPTNISVKTDVGWARLDSHSGEFLRDEAKKELRPVIIKEANTTLFLDRAQVNATKTLKDLCNPLYGLLKNRYELEVQFK